MDQRDFHYPRTISSGITSKKMIFKKLAEMFCKHVKKCRFNQKTWTISNTKLLTRQFALFISKVD